MDKKKRVLIVVNNYLEDSLISAKRWRSLSRFFAKDNEVVVICGLDYMYKGKLIDKSNLENENLKIHQLNTTDSLIIRKRKIVREETNITVSEETKNKDGLLKSIIQYVKLFLYYIIVKRRSIKIMKSNRKIINNFKPDIVISSIFYYNAFFMGKYIHKAIKNSVFITEVRDRMTYGDHINKYELPIMYKLEKNILKSSDLVFTVTEQIKDEILSDFNNREYLDKIIVFPHAYDSNEDSIEVNHEPEKTDFLELCFTGTMYEEDYLIFGTLFDVIMNNETLKNKVRLHYAGTKDYLINDISQKHYFLNNIVNHSLLTKKEALLLQKTCDVIIYRGGTFAGKGPEILFANKYVLCLYDDKNGLCLNMPTIISKANIGTSFSISENKEYLEDVLMKLVKEKEDYKDIRVNPNYDFINNFSIDQIGLQMIKTIESFEEKR